MTSALRRLFLTLHITVSIGWIGAVVSFLVLNVVALATRNGEMARSAYLSMNIIGLYAVVPLSLGALASGLVQSLGTHWGLLRHYWVVAKLLLTILAVYALLMHQFATVTHAERLASADSRAVGLNAQLRSLGMEILGDASGGLLVLLVITTLAVYKPWGLTRYGSIKQTGDTLQFENDPRAPRGFGILLAIIAALILIFKVTLHLTGHNMHHVR